VGKVNAEEVMGVLREHKNNKVNLKKVQEEPKL